MNVKDYRKLDLLPTTGKCYEIDNAIFGMMGNLGKIAAAIDKERYHNTPVCK